MDGVSTTTTIITIIIWTFQALGKAHNAFQEISEIPDSIAGFDKEITTVQRLLLLLANNIGQWPDQFVHLQPLLKDCTLQADKFVAVLSKHKNPSTSLGRRVIVWSRLKWNEKEITSLRSLLTRSKDDIGLVLGALNLTNTALTKEIIDEIKILLKRTTEETKTHLEAMDSQTRQLQSQEAPLNEQDKRRWHELESERIKYEKNLACLAEVSNQLMDIKLSDIETILSSDHSPTTILAERFSPMTVSNFETFKTKLPHLVQTIDAKRIKIVTEQQDLYFNVKNLEELQQKTRIAQENLEALETGSRQLNEQYNHIFRDNEGAEDSQLVCAATKDRASHFVGNKLGRNSRMTLGHLPDTLLQASLGIERSTTKETPSPSQSFSITLPTSSIFVFVFFLSILCMPLFKLAAGQRI